MQLTFNSANLSLSGVRFQEKCKGPEFLKHFVTELKLLTVRRIRILLAKKNSKPLAINFSNHM